MTETKSNQEPGKKDPLENEKEKTPLTKEQPDKKIISPEGPDNNNPEKGNPNLEKNPIE